jgi:hypothetical protein
MSGQTAPPLPDSWIAITDICRELRMTRVMFDHIVADHPELNIAPIEQYRLPRGKLARAVPRTAYQRLAEWLPPFAPAGWYSMSQLIRRTGWPKYTLAQYLTSISAESRPYRVPYGTIAAHYRLADLAALGAPSRVPPAGDWLTVDAICKIIGRSRYWINRHIDSRLAEMRLASNGVAQPHYPPGEMRMLRARSEAEKALAQPLPPERPSVPLAPPAEDWLTLSALEEALGRSKYWIKARLNHRLGSKRMARDRQVRLHYPPAELGRLRKVSDQERADKAARRQPPSPEHPPPPEHQQPPAGEWLTLTGIAKQLDKTAQWVSERINRELAEDRRTANNRVKPHYPPSELERLRALITAEVPAGDWLTLDKLAQALGCTRDWVEARVHADQAEERIAANGRQLPHYPPSVLEHLRALLETQAPPAGDWLTIHAIAEAIDRLYRWVEFRINPELAEDRLTNHGSTLPHYPPSELERLRALTAAEIPAGDWLTVSTIAEDLNHAPSWVQARINHDLAEERLGQNGHPNPHYPPSELERLRALAAAEVPAGDWLNTPSIAAAVNRSTRWVANRLNHDLAETRVGAEGKTSAYYPPSELERLKVLVATEVPPGDWLTTRAIAQACGRPSPWVEQRLNHDLAEERVATNGHPLSHYPPSELERLQAVLDTIPPAGDWVTAEIIIKELGQNRRWVKSRLNPELAAVRLAANGTERIHYPPSELERLRALPKGKRRNAS